jgi:hypothetical protein
LYEPRAAFYTEKGAKKQNKNAGCQRRQEKFPADISTPRDESKKLEIGRRSDLK